MDIDRLEKMLQEAIKNKIEDKKLNAIVMSQISLGLAEVCDKLTKIEEKKLIDFEAKLEVSKKGLSKLQLKQINKSLESYKNNKQSFEKYAGIFSKLGELSEGTANG